MYRLFHENSILIGDCMLVNVFGKNVLPCLEKNRTFL